MAVQQHVKIHTSDEFRNNQKIVAICGGRDLSVLITSREIDRFTSRVTVQFLSYTASDPLEQQHLYSEGKTNFQVTLGVHAHTYSCNQHKSNLNIFVCKILSLCLIPIKFIILKTYYFTAVRIINIIAALQKPASHPSRSYRTCVYIQYAIDSDEGDAIASNISAVINMSFALSRPTVINTSLMHTL